MGDLSSQIPTSLIADLQKLLPSLEIVTPQSQNYSQSISRWYARDERYAAAVLYPSCTQDISSILSFTTKHAVPISVKGGGHGTRAPSSIEGGFCIDLDKMQKVNIDVATKTIAVEGGARWRQVNDEAGEHGLAVVGGIAYDVGVGGLALHGGYGWLTGQRGLAVDNILEMEVVLADGKIVMLNTANEQHADLWWAMRGAGGALGVVSKFVLKAFEQKEKVWRGNMVLPRSCLKVVLQLCNKCMSPNASGVAALIPAFSTMPTDEGLTPTLVIWSFYNGPEEEAQDFFAPLWKLDAIKDEGGMVPFSKSLMESASPPGKHWRKMWNGGALTAPINMEFMEELMDDFEAFVRRVPDAAKTVAVFELHNGYATIAQPGNALPNRGNHGNVLIVATWTEAENNELCKEWLQAFGGKLAKELKRRQIDDEMDEVSKTSTGLYVNYDGIGIGAKKLYGHNYARLVEVKRKYDRQNVFRRLVDLLADE